MQAEIKSIAHDVRDALKAAQIDISSGHVHEFLAAAFGYASWAAFTQSKLEPASISASEFLALDLPRMRLRAPALGHPATTVDAVADAIRDAIAGVASAPAVFVEQDELLDHVRQEVESTVYDDEQVASEAATTNGTYDEVEAETLDAPAHPTATSGSWAMPITGILHIDQDPDRVFFGDEVSFDGVVTFQKVGLAGLNFDKVVIHNASVVHDYAEPDDDGPAGHTNP